MKNILSLVPKEVNDYVESLILNQNLIIKTVPMRKTKHGDFRKTNKRIRRPQHQYIFTSRDLCCDFY